MPEEIKALFIRDRGKRIVGVYVFEDGDERSQRVFGPKSDDAIVQAFAALHSTKVLGCNSMQSGYNFAFNKDRMPFVEPKVGP
jgi:hypothetical protein